MIAYLFVPCLLVSGPCWTLPCWWALQAKRCGIDQLESARKNIIPTSMTKGPSQPSFRLISRGFSVAGFPYRYIVGGAAYNRVLCGYPITALGVTRWRRTNAHRLRTSPRPPWRCCFAEKNFGKRGPQRHLCPFKKSHVTSGHVLYPTNFLPRRPPPPVNSASIYF